MEFWGAEVKPGQHLKVNPDDHCFIHISQASLGESKNKSSESVPVFVKIGDQKFVLGTLSHENFPQITFDLVFEKEFELSHNWKNGSVYIIGYQSPNIDGEDEEGCCDDSEASDEEDLPVTAAENVKVGTAIENAKPAKANAGKPESQPKAKSEEAKKGVKPNSEEDNESDEDDESDEDEESDSEEGMDVDDDSNDDESEDEDEETPKKVEQPKKRAPESATKTPVPAKKAKAATPNTDGKRGNHTATPHPAKKSGKTPANASQSPKSGGQFSRGSGKKSFTPRGGLQSHNKAKHGGK